MQKVHEDWQTFPGNDDDPNKAISSLTPFGNKWTNVVKQQKIGHENPQVYQRKNYDGIF